MAIYRIGQARVGLGDKGEPGALMKALKHAAEHIKVAAAVHAEGGNGHGHAVLGKHKQHEEEQQKQQIREQNLVAQTSVAYSPPIVQQQHIVQT